MQIVVPRKLSSHPIITVIDAQQRTFSRPALDFVHSYSVKVIYPTYFSLRWVKLSIPNDQSLLTLS